MLKDIAEYYQERAYKYQQYLSSLSPKEKEKVLSDSLSKCSQLNKEWENRDSVVASISYIKEFAETSLTDADKKERERWKKRNRKNG